jgi:hypothetical protein
MVGKYQALNSLKRGRPQPVDATPSDMNSFSKGTPGSNLLRTALLPVADARTSRGVRLSHSLITALLAGRGDRNRFN